MYLKYTHRVSTVWKFSVNISNHLNILIFEQGEDYVQKKSN